MKPSILDRAESTSRHPRHPALRSYSVWAPIPASVVLELNGTRLPMTRRDDGWWFAAAQMRAGDRYGFVVDGDGPFPDPRSASQPDGVHGLSACVDHSQFAWTDQRWQPRPLASAVIYEMHIGTFSEAGTFAGAIERLPHLAELGVTHLELMPIVEFPGKRGWGYDGVDLFAPHHGYGSPDDLRRFVDACHAHGLAVLLDVVYNHFGPSGNYLTRFGPYFTARYRTPWGDAVNLDDGGADEVRRFFCDNALMWLRDYHFDGLRLDAVHALVDTSATHFLEQLAYEVDTLEAVLGRHFVLTAESDLNDPRVIRAKEAGGFGIDAQWSDDFHHALHGVLTGERAGYYEDFGSRAQLTAALRQGFVYAGSRSPHRRRAHGREPHDMPGWRFIVATQNHDQIGNRATGERLSHLVPPGRLKIAAAILFTSPFVPLMFQGEEWGASSPFQYFTSHDEPELAAAVSEGRKREFAAFGWPMDAVPDPQDVGTFERSRLRWDETTASPHAGMLDWYRSLIALRREHPSLLDGCMREVHVTDDGAGVMSIGRGPIAIVFNLSGEQQTWAAERPVRLLLASRDDIVLRAGAIALPPDAVAIVQAERPED